MTKTAEQRRADKAAAERRRRARMTTEQLEAIAQSQRERRASLKQERRQQLRSAASQSQRNRLADMTPEQRNEVRASNASSQQRRRAAISPERRTEVRASQATYQRQCRQPQLAEIITHKRTESMAIKNHEEIDESELKYALLSLGEMNVECDKCHALHFKAERPSDKQFTICCQKGKLAEGPAKLKPIQCDELITKLMKGEHPDSQHFLDNIRNFNSSLSFASMGANMRKPPGHGPYCFRIQGTLYHRYGALHPAQGKVAQYAQMYILDPDEAKRNFSNDERNKQCNADLFAKLREVVAPNHLARSYRMMYEIEQEEVDRIKNAAEIERTKAIAAAIAANKSVGEAAKEGEAAYKAAIKPPEITMAITTENNRPFKIYGCNDERRYNAPIVDEIAMVFDSADGAPPQNRDIIVKLRNDGQLESIAVTHRFLDALLFVILFPKGDLGWHVDMKYKCPITGKLIRVSQMHYYSHRLQVRKDEFNPILNAGKLAQQYMVSAYCNMEANRLFWLETNQDEIRSEAYHVLQQHANNVEPSKAGKMFVLPSTFIGSPRAMDENYKDAMAIVGKCGKPDLFITMTCNPNWVEITSQLQYMQKREHRADLFTRVFRCKYRQLIDDIYNKHVFGIPVAYVYVIEFQKRGLPHAHIMVILHPQYKCNSGNNPLEKIDGMVSAEIPNPATQPRLHEYVMKHMIHGPCGNANPTAPCMKNGKCNKKFPKAQCAETNANNDSFALYRRRKLQTYSAAGRGQSRREVDDGWVVPYNPFLLLKYNCHINVEWCYSINSVKYMFKYIYKGHDCAELGINYNEIKSYVNARYVAASNACWRIFSFPMSGRSHTVCRLAVHLEDRQPVYFRNNDIDNALQCADFKFTTLTAWFRLNAKDAYARQFKYGETPEHYSYNPHTHAWKRRVKNMKVIGRMNNISVKAGELFYLRLLLLHVTGAVSFEDIRTFNGEIFATFKAAAIARGLLADDFQMDACLKEASEIKMPKELRRMFAYMCLYSELQDPMALWRKYATSLQQDYLRDIKESGRDERLAKLYALYDIQEVFAGNGKSLKDCGLHYQPIPIELAPMQRDNDAIARHEHHAKAKEQKQMLNPQQRSAFDNVIAAVKDDNIRDRVFFLDGPGGSGKTFTYQAIYHKVNYMKKGLNEANIKYRQMTCVASTGIAANLLPMGRTVHSTFGIGIEFDEHSVSRITPSSAEGQLLNAADIIVWDECTMSSYALPIVVDRLLRDLATDPNKRSQPFGGKVVVFGGDFRQTLPVIRRSNESKIVLSCINKSPLWNNIRTLKLSTNMRVRNECDNEFRQWLLDLGEGKLTKDFNLGQDVIEIPQEFIEQGDLIDAIYGTGHIINDPSIYGKVILCPKNKDVHAMNARLLERIDGPAKEYYSIDSIVPDDHIDTSAYTVEYLNTLNPSGSPLHKLTVKVDAIVMLLRNLDTKRGLCNGTRLVVQQLFDNVMQVEILSGRAKGEKAMIPRIDVVPSDTTLPFKFQRRQFPIMLAFAMTINKSQGQSFESVGIYLPANVFSHGHLYVAFSRCTSKANIRVKIDEVPNKQGKLIPGSDQVFTTNVVYKGVFDTPTNPVLPEQPIIEYDDYSSDSDSDSDPDEFDEYHQNDNANEWQLLIDTQIPSHIEQNIQQDIDHDIEYDSDESDREINRQFDILVKEHADRQRETQMERQLQQELERARAMNLNMIDPYGNPIAIRPEFLREEQLAEIERERENEENMAAQIEIERQQREHEMRVDHARSMLNSSTN